MEAVYMACYKTKNKEKVQEGMKNVNTTINKIILLVLIVVGFATCYFAIYQYKQLKENYKVLQKKEQKLTIKYEEAKNDSKMLDFLLPTFYYIILLGVVNKVAPLPAGFCGGFLNMLKVRRKSCLEQIRAAPAKIALEVRNILNTLKRK